MTGHCTHASFHVLTAVDSQVGVLHLKFELYLLNFRSEFFFVNIFSFCGGNLFFRVIVVNIYQTVYILC